MSTLKADTIQSTSGGAATLTNQSPAKMWAFIEGDGTPSITGSFNVASLTDEDTGVVRANFTNNMSNANFSNIGTAKENSFIACIQELSGTYVRATSSMVLKTHSTSSASDADGRNYALFGDLA
jgi:hypothetical protein